MIEESKDLSAISFEELAGSLEAHEQRKMKKKEEARQTRESKKEEKLLYSQNFRGRGHGHGERGSGRTNQSNNFEGYNREKGQSSQSNWRGRGCGGGRSVWSNHSNAECYKCGKYGHYAKDYNPYRCYSCGKMGHLAKYFRSGKKVEETTNLAIENVGNEGFLLMAQNEVDTNKDTLWYLDYGESNHMCGHEHLFK